MFNNKFPLARFQLRQQTPLRTGQCNTQIIEVAKVNIGDLNYSPVHRYKTAPSAHIPTITLTLFPGHKNGDRLLRAPSVTVVFLCHRKCLQGRAPQCFLV